MRTATIHQLVVFHAPPEDVYEALMNSAAHAQFTGEPASISATVGGEFNAHNQHVSGTNLELDPGRKIVQRWRVVTWPSGHWSTVHFTFEPSDRGTLLRFMHQDIPSDNAKEIDIGWEERYWKPLKKYLKTPKAAAKPAKTKPKTKKPAAKPKAKKKR
ncbi:MAG TPA: SRPBCC domain-containing protein [Candidatus Peribacteria bacterium]|nr:SRPBCC domain-containing protein [Candidatus Peribacteria bacterium]